MSEDVEVSTIGFRPRRKKRQPRLIKTKKILKKDVVSSKKDLNLPKLEFFVIEAEGNFALCGVGLDTNFSPKKEHDKNIRTLLSILPRNQNQPIKIGKVEYYYPKEYLKIS